MKNLKAHYDNGRSASPDRKYSGRGDNNISRFKKLDLSINIEDSNAEPDKTKQKPENPNA